MNEHINRNRILSVGFFIILILGWLMSLSSSMGRANSAGAGSTGAPCDNSLPCGNALCHSGNSFGQTTQKFELRDIGTSQEVFVYEPGKIYTARVSVLSGAGTGRFGFQATALDTTNNNAGTWLNPGTNIQIATAPDCKGNTRIYIEHISPHLFNTFSMQWQAPPCDIGKVKFYFSGNKVNNNGGPTGDSGGLGDSMIYSSSSINVLALNDQPILPGEYFANESIHSTGIIGTLSSVGFNAGDSVIMTPEFNVENGAEFTVQITECN